MGRNLGPETSGRKNNISSIGEIESQVFED